MTQHLNNPMPGNLPAYGYPSPSLLPPFPDPVGPQATQPEPIIRNQRTLRLEDPESGTRGFSALIERAALDMFLAGVPSHAIITVGTRLEDDLNNVSLVAHWDERKRPWPSITARTPPTRK